MTDKELKVFADRIRLESIKSIASYGGGHVGGVLSMAELFAVLYGNIMRVDSRNPKWNNRDRLVLSKGHCGPVLYSALALKGFFPLKMLLTLNKDGSDLPSHCNMFHTPGVDACTGSLGQGGSIGVGMALGLKMQGKDSRVYVVLGDGECDEGQVWEFALFAAHNHVDNLIAFIDRNHQQLDGYTSDVCEVGNLAKKFEDFGWNVHTVDGHSVKEIENAIKDSMTVKGKPTMIVLETIKGKGWSVTEGKSNIHHITINSEQLKCAEEELCAKIKKVEADG